MDLKAWYNWRRKRFWLVVLLLSYTLGGFLLLPRLIQYQFARQLSVDGHVASLAEVKVNPYALSLLVQGAEISREGEATLLAFDEFFADLQLSSLFHRAWTFRVIRLEGLTLNERRYSGVDTRVRRLLTALQTGVAETPEGGVEATLPRLILYQLQLDIRRLQLVDEQVNGFTLNLGPINVDVQDLRTLPEHVGRQRVSIANEHGGRVEWEGTVEFLPFRSEGRLFVSRGAMTDGFRYADHFLPFNMDHEGVEASLDYRLSLAAPGPRLDIDNLQAEISGLRLTEDDASITTLASRSLTLKGGSLRWPELTASLDSLAIAGLELDLALEQDGSLNIERLLPSAESQTTTGPDDSAREQDFQSANTAQAPADWQWQVGSLSLEDASVRLRDLQVEPALELQLLELDASLDGLDNLPGTQVPMRADFSLSSGGRIGYTGTLTWLPEFTSSGDLQVDEMQISVLQPYLNSMARVRLDAGLASLRAELNLPATLAAQVSGAANISDFQMSSAVQAEKLIAWKRLDLERFELDLGANTLSTSVLEFDGLFGRLHIAEDLTTNVSGLLLEPASEESTGSDSEPMGITVGGLELQNASLDFSDFSLPLPFRANIRKLQGTVSTLSSTSAEPADLDLEGQVNKYGLARISGRLNAWDPTALADVQMAFRNLEMERLTPYVVAFAGYGIEAGRLDLDLDYDLNQRQLAGQNKVVIRELTLGEKIESPGAGSLPLGLAVALLKDANGVIEIDLPVSGSLDDPEFRIGGLIWKALGNLIAKAVTAPFRLLGALVGMDSEDFGRMEFQPGRTDISPPDLEKLVKLSEAMAQRPELTVEVGGVWAEPDRAALRQVKADELIAATVAALPANPKQLSTERERQALETLVLQQQPETDLALLQTQFTLAAENGEPAGQLDEPAYQAALKERVVESLEVSDAELAGLADARAAAVVAGLQGGTAGESAVALPVTILDSKQVEAGEGDQVPLELGVASQR